MAVAGLLRPGFKLNLRRLRQASRHSSGLQDVPLMGPCLPILKLTSGALPKVVASAWSFRMLDCLLTCRSYGTSTSEPGGLRRAKSSLMTLLVSLVFNIS
jgi:hypothetical protein